MVRSKNNKILHTIRKSEFRKMIIVVTCYYIILLPNNLCDTREID